MTRPGTVRRQALDGARMLVAGCALVVGVFGWLVAHTVTYLLLMHSHGGVVGATAGHDHHSRATGTVTVGCLVAAAMLVVACTGAPRRSVGRSPRRRSVASWSSGLSTVAFLTAELTEHAARGDGPPPAVLLLGAVVHALIGAAASLLWWRFTAGLQRLLGCRDDIDVPLRIPGVRGVPAQTSRQRERLLVYAIAGRAPPASVLA